MAEPPSFLTAIAGMTGAAMAGGPIDLTLIASQLDTLASETGYTSLNTLATGFRELQTDIDNATKVIEHDD